MSNDKTVWNINTGHPEIVHESPLEKGIWHMPPDVCEVEPPEFDDAKQNCKYDGSKWIVTEYNPRKDYLDSLPKINNPE
mgnify:FL=1|tara:strand:- start:66 stop:302 length:237 start_codon:yes stop_codon:yes gene_type:complete